MKNKKYDVALEGLFKASTKEALQHIRSLREQEAPQFDQILEHKLITFRLAIKAGSGKYLDESELPADDAKSRFLCAEGWFVKGVIFSYKEKLLDASHAFLRAAEFYLDEGRFDKHLLSRFNSLIALANAGQLTPQDEINLCGEILRDACEKKIPSIQAMALRQRSYAYFASDRFLASLQEVKEALTLFEIHGPVSDFHLSLIHASDCAFESKDLHLARVYLDYLPHQVDARVEFPRAYMQAKLGGIPLDESLFPDLNSHWKARYSHWIKKTQTQNTTAIKKYFWEIKTHRIISENKQILAKIKPNSLEGQLLKILAKGPLGKDLICEILWPDSYHNLNLDERFFRLKSRLQQKIGSSLVFDGEVYMLSIAVELC